MAKNHSDVCKFQRNSIFDAATYLKFGITIAYLQKLEIFGPLTMPIKSILNNFVDFVFCET